MEVRLFLKLSLVSADDLSTARDQRFSTSDRGTELTRTCAANLQTGWWLDSACTQSGDLNNGNHSALTWGGAQLKQVEMFVRNIQFQGKDRSVDTYG